MGYRRLDPERIQETAGALRARISERFPDSGLERVAAEVVTVVGESRSLSEFLGRPYRFVRGLAAGAIVLMLALVAGTFLALNRKVALFGSVAEFLQGLDAAVNEIILLGVGLFFLLSWESRIKRHRALGALHTLRSLAHIVDMHQLTKDPERALRILHPSGETPSSPQRSLTPFELTRYLDYCSELLAIVSKLAALYVQDFDDPPTLAVVSDVQNLCNNLSGKIWQKIMILDRVIAAG